MTRRSLALLLLSSAAIGAAGCGDSLQGPCAGNACSSQRSVTNVFQTNVNNQLDVLFVVDDSSAIAPYDAAVANGIVEMMGVLQNALPGVPSLHVGFVPASACAGAARTRGAECGLPAPMQYLRSETCAQVTNFPGALADASSCLADLGTGGCAPAQPFAAIERALGQAPPGWEGFLRPTAYLAIVILTASDDASGPDGAPDPVSKTVDLVRSLKDDPATQILVSIVGPADCTPGAVAAPMAPRLLGLAQAFGSNGLSYPICAEHFGPALSILSRRLAVLIEPKCFGPVRDMDLATPGLQANCVVTDTVAQPDGSSTTTVLPSCDLSSPPCWSLGASSPDWACAGKLTLSVDRGASYCPDNAARTLIECLGCLDPNDPACAPPQ